jgi:hypothetical protein
MHRDSRFPICEREDCRFTEGLSTVTAMGWTPEYDKHGRLLNHNPNISQTDVMCSTCNKSWIRRTQHGETTFTGLNHGTA